MADGADEPLEALGACMLLSRTLLGDRVPAIPFDLGDANGADKAVQRYLADNGYRDVVVHCMAGNCRNNVGNWPIHESQAPRGARGFEYYATKDQAMVDAADYGLMLWDGESKGTLNSVLKMVRLAKPVVVYFAPNKILSTDFRRPAERRGHRRADTGDAERVVLTPELVVSRAGSNRL